MKLPFRLGHYVLTELVASGGMAQVFRGKALGPGGFEKTVAVKMIHPHLSADRDFIDMLIDEAKLTAGLTHPNIAQTIDFLEDENRYFLVMEYIDGQNLRGILKRAEELGRPLAFPDAAFIALGAASGLGFAHSRMDEDDRHLGIIHRDVSPQNILVSYEGDVKLVDFGVAKAAGRLSVTQTGVLKGKFAYMSPEQADGQALDHRSDIFSLGVVMYELFTGNRLFQGDSDISTLRRVREARVEPPRKTCPEIPEELEVITLRCLAREPGGRYQAAARLRDDLQLFLSRAGYFQSSQTLSRYLREAFSEERKKNRKEEEKEFKKILTESGSESASSSSLIGTTPLLLPESDEKDATRKLAGKPPAPWLRVIFAGVLILMLAAAGFWVYPRLVKTGSSPAAVVVPPAAPAVLPANPSAPPPPIAPAPAEREQPRMVSTGEAERKIPAPPPERKTLPPTVFPPAPAPKPIEVVQPQPDVVLPSEDLSPEVKPRTAVKTLVVVTPARSEVPVPARAPAEPGILALNVLPWAMVFIDGEKKGRNTPIISLELAPGYHSVRIINTELKVDRTVPFEIKTGETTRQIIKLTSD
ncbi:MAG: protein kinase [bacterium]|nr:protein kinase [bacterium]